MVSLYSGRPRCEVTLPGEPAAFGDARLPAGSGWLCPLAASTCRLQASDDVAGDPDVANTSVRAVHVVEHLDDAVGHADGHEQRGHVESSCVGARRQRAPAKW